MMCDNLSVYKSLPPSTSILPQNSSTTMNTHFFPIHDEDDDDDRPYMSVKRKLSGLYNLSRLGDCRYFCFLGDLNC
jgi:hypothetical protein